MSHDVSSAAKEKHHIQVSPRARKAIRGRSSRSSHGLLGIHSSKHASVHLSDDLVRHDDSDAELYRDQEPRAKRKTSAKIQHFSSSRETRRTHLISQTHKHP